MRSPKAILFDWNNTLTKVPEFNDVMHFDPNFFTCAMSGAESLLNFLHDRSLYMALVSNEYGDKLRREVRDMRWEKYFNKIVGAGDALENKPSIAPVKLALEGSGIDPGEEVWFVGDSITDMECAHNSKLVAVLYGDNISVDSMRHKPYLHVRDYLIMIDLLKSIIKF